MSMADEKTKPDKAADKGARQPKGGKPDGKAAAAAKGKGQPAEKAAPKPKAARPKDYKPRLKVQYETVVKTELTSKFGYKNHMQVPRLEKIVLNMGVGEAVNDRKKVDNAAGDLALIAGQRPVITVRSAMAPSSSDCCWVARPTPQLRTIFSRRGTCITLPSCSSSLSVGTSSVR
jgi:large subunit ribosomal protein L5